MKRPFNTSDVPHRPGVYVYRDRFGQVIYVGKARDLRRRMSSYFQPARAARADAKLRSLINSIDDWSFQVVRSEDEALILESRLIKEYAPYYNILMRDDKRYPLLRTDPRELYPTLKQARFRRDDGALYFGPFPQSGALRVTLEFLLAHFGLRACRDSEPDGETRKRCLKRIVRDCCAPCTGAVTPAEYRARYEQALAVLNGDLSGVLAAANEKMNAAAAARRYEQAAAFRDIITNIEAVFAHRSRRFDHPELPRVPAGRVAAEELQRELGLPRYPATVIGFDNSNLLGTMAVSSMVVFRDGRPERAAYRRFRIRTVEGADDFATMKEVLTRHFGRLLAEKAPLPDLTVIDGGKGQLSAAVEALVALHCPPIPVIGLAKREEEVFLPGRSEPVRLDRHAPALRLLQALRDESHRFAITYHRQLRLKAMEQSQLDEIPGIGPVRKRQLLKAFGSVRAIRRATAEELAAKVPGIGPAAAARIRAALDPGSAADPVTAPR